MTQTLNIANHNGCNFTKEEIQWPVFNQNQEFCGRIHKIAAHSVPSMVYKDLQLPSHLNLYLSTEGHWAPTFESAEHYLSATKPPIEFLVKGSCLNLFAALQWVPNAQSNYRVYRRLDDGWDVEEVGEVKEVEELPMEAVDFEYF
jgi:hypothetical protein